jgi:hypothetical protein
MIARSKILVLVWVIDDAGFHAIARGVSRERIGARRESVERESTLIVGRNGSNAKSLRLNV